MNSSKDKLAYDVVIIGGGVIGLTIARALALRDIREICVLERGAWARRHHSQLAACSRHKLKQTRVTNYSTFFGKVAISTQTLLPL
jgi:choline dehydrogenase-like flavoprotein